MSIKKCLAIIVTYNRKKLLERILNALNNQKEREIFDILVIVNGSTDGTVEFLQDNSFEYILQDNVGGAGGIATGMKYAEERFYSYVWVMDDDGRPQEDTFINLWNKRNEDSVIGSMVVSEDDESKLSFAVRDLNKIFPKYINDVEYVKSNANNGLYGWGMFFNSVIFPISVIKKVGYPDARYFIIGDEEEYFYRIKKQGIDINLVVNSIFRHPATFASGPEWKNKYRIRNSIINAKKYKNFYIVYLLWKIIKIFLSGKFHLLAAYQDGIFGRFNNTYHIKK